MDGWQCRAAPWLAAVGCALIGLGCSQREVPRNVVLAVADTLRADHLGSYGYTRATSPRIDAFGRDALLFRSVRSQAPCTFPSVNSLLTSRYPQHFAARWSLGFGIPPRMTTLPEVLRRQGFHTGAVSASPIVRDTPSDENPEGGFGRGFGHFDESCLERDAACVNEVALRLLDELPEPFFLYLHYMDPHGPYRPPASHQRRFSVEVPGFLDDGDPRPLARELYREGGSLELDAAGRQQLVDLYDEEIAYFDERFGDLLDALERRGLARRTIVVLAADHGEEFLEHGDLLHCRSLHDTQIRTPLIVRIPGVRGGRVIEASVQNLDVGPTLLDYLGLAGAGPRPEGTSLRRLIESPQTGNEPVFSAWERTRAVVAERHKLLLDLDTDRVRLYDLVEDPAETTDVAAARPELVERLRREIEAQEARLPAYARQRHDRVEKRLRALGYLE